MRIDKPSKPARGAAFAAAAAAVLAAVFLIANAANAVEGTPTLAGNTLSAVTWVPRSNAAGGGALRRFVLQAYLRPDGTALVRVWDAPRNSYTRPEERRWGLSGSRLCLDLPVPPGPERICAEIHEWGPRIAGVGTLPYVMLDGDLKPGNAILGGH